MQLSSVHTTTFYTTATIYRTVIYAQQFSQRFSKKNLCSFVCSERGPLLTIKLCFVEFLTFYLLLVSHTFYTRLIWRDSIHTYYRVCSDDFKLNTAVLATQITFTFSFAENIWVFCLGILFHYCSNKIHACLQLLVIFIILNLCRENFQHVKLNHQVLIKLGSPSAFFHNGFAQNHSWAITLFPRFEEKTQGSVSVKWRSRNVETMREAL